MNVQERCSLLFNVIKDVEKKPLKIPLKEFDEHWWPLVSNVWTVTGGPWPYSTGDDFGCYSVYICCLAKKVDSSTQKEGMPVRKWRRTAIHFSVECEAVLGQVFSEGMMCNKNQRKNVVFLKSDRMWSFIAHIP